MGHDLAVLLRAVPPFELAISQAIYHSKSCEALTMLSLLSCQVTREVCMEAFERVPQLGRLTLRDEGKTIAIGKILRLL
jgi:translation elongation factor EF-1alpha